MAQQGMAGDQVDPPIPARPGPLLQRRQQRPRVAAALEERTRACGYRRIYLITGNRQPEAEALALATGR
ncbi:hypothetical protein MAHJHV60_45760 [Mycobacterium avium subsp. hominissuis]